MGFQINDDERSSLYGLPHIQQLIYYNGIRPYMDYRTGIVGEKRGISHQSLAEEIYIAPHSGVKTQKFSRDQIRRAVEGLQRAGVIQIQSIGRTLKIHCRLATYNFNQQNKAAILPPDQVALRDKINIPDFSDGYEKNILQPADEKRTQAAIPLLTDLNKHKYSLRKEKISSDFQPSVSVIENAKKHASENGLSQEELSRFIAYHQSKGTESYDWDAEYFYWILNTKRFQQGRRKNESQIKPNVSKPRSAVERVALANQHFFQDSTLQQAKDNHNDRHCLAVDGDDSGVRSEIRE